MHELRTKRVSCNSRCPCTACIIIYHIATYDDSSWAKFRKESQSFFLVECTARLCSQYSSSTVNCFSRGTTQTWYLLFARFFYLNICLLDLTIYHKNLLRSGMISVSKLCCPVCWELLAILNEDKPLSLRGCHPMIYAVELPKWLPSEIVDEMNERFQNYLQQELDIMVRGAANSEQGVFQQNPSRHTTHESQTLVNIPLNWRTTTSTRSRPPAGHAFHVQLFFWDFLFTIKPLESTSIKFLFLPIPRPGAVHWQLDLDSELQVVRLGVVQVQVQVQVYSRSLPRPLSSCLHLPFFVHAVVMGKWFIFVVDVIT